MLAYVFWHWPAPGVDPGPYAERLTRFHRALGASAPRGFHGSRVFGVGAVPGLPVAPELFEDWYFVEDFTALGVLNEAAVATGTREAHGAAAALAGGGTAGVYKLCSARTREPASAAWFEKPAGSSYDAFVRTVPAAIELWQRQMTLGPAPEFCALARRDEGDSHETAAFLGAARTRLRTVRPVLE